jgi:hypothetical protein
MSEIFAMLDLELLFESKLKCFETMGAEEPNLFLHSILIWLNGLFKVTLA